MTNYTNSTIMLQLTNILSTCIHIHKENVVQKDDTNYDIVGCKKVL